VFGERDEIGMTNEEREVFERSPHVTLVEIPDAGHFALNQKPGEIATIVLEAIDATASHRSAPTPAS
jgi:pimeloyl-ACP methyl ester carboxylesterase